MSLQAGVQVIVRCGEENGLFDCLTFDGLAITNPAVVTFVHPASPQAASNALALRDAMVNALVALGGQPLSQPCYGRPNDLEACHALHEAHCQKLLVLVGDDNQPFAAGSYLTPWTSNTDPTFTALPVMPIASRPNVTSLLPSAMARQNVTFWTSSLDEALPAVFANAGLTYETPKIFISYRREETAALAVQLFDALSHEGYDAFLDHFRIPPGVNFQARLTQELGDKSMVLMLESATFLRSQWIDYEIAVAKACSLGVFALNIDGANKTPGIDDEVRLTIDRGDFLGGVADARAELTLSALERILTAIRIEHDRAQFRRRRILETALTDAILQAGGNLPIRLGHGCIQVDQIGRGGRSYLVALTTRPPDLPDFHRLGGIATTPGSGVIIGLSRLMEPPRVERLIWLAGLSQLAFRDEGELVSVAEQMVRGTL